MKPFSVLYEVKVEAEAWSQQAPEVNVALNSISNKILIHEDFHLFCIGRGLTITELLIH